METAARKGDLTKGPVGKQLLLFALPLLGASLIQQLYNTVDLLFVGNLLGKEATAAVGAGSLLTTCIVGFFTGLSIGTGVVVSLAAAVVLTVCWRRFLRRWEKNREKQKNRSPAGACQPK